MYLEERKKILKQPAGRKGRGRKSLPSKSAKSLPEKTRKKAVLKLDADVGVDFIAERCETCAEFCQKDLQNFEAMKQFGCILLTYSDGRARLVPLATDQSQK